MSDSEFFRNRSLSKLMKMPLSVSVLGNSFSVPGPGAPNWFYEMCGYSGGLLRINTASGVGGNTSAMMIARLSSIPTTSDVCFVLEGSNDSGIVSVQTHITNYKTICTYLLAQGTLPIIVLSPPKNSSVVWVSQARIAEYRLACVLGIPVIDPFGGYFDTATGDWASGASGDGTHPVELVYRDAGRLSVSQLRNGASNMLMAMSNVWGDTVGNNLNLLSTVGVATGWNSNNVASGAVPTIASAVSDGFIGNWQTFTATAIANGTSSYMYRDLTLPANWLLTDTFLISAGIKVTNTNNMGATVFVRWKNSGGGGIRDDAFLYNTLTVGGLNPRYWQQEVVPPAGAASASLWIQMQANGAGTYSGSVSIAQSMVVDMTLLSGY